MNRIIYILPIGKIEGEVLAAVKEGLEEVYPFPAKIISEVPNPAYAFEPSRGQYYSSKILKEIVNHLPPNSLKILGITEVDLCTPVLTFVFGEAQLKGKSAVISLARLRPEYYTLPPNPSLFLTRVVKEAIHELGHTFGLVHCALKECVMAFAPDVWGIDQKLKHFCPCCQDFLMKMIKELEGKSWEEK
ncbi:MAG: archaemetzincin family Zn-dependent metalloprotease [candidate division WOR-3 bacterium]